MHELDAERAGFVCSDAVDEAYSDVEPAEFVSVASAYD